ncbi:PREDICTED: leukocyte-associated immunoglobulin-like receptor 2 [Myotis davidii]|uniref:leukocyte-associated immunoglobulin-like receptor 2 n=1 Tax=Myotis davidii TaxID=225400 RepID=UPI0007671CB7|nr:PREDICTED: leukocyte-associated immunoglobulin-like receptor 2 [Myotis davidii]
MSPRPSTLLGLVLCLVQTIHMQPRLLPKPVLWAEPGPVVPRGQPVTFVCSFPVWAEFSRLEKDGKHFQGQKILSQDGSLATEYRFHFPAVSEDMAGSYRCRYHDVLERWSERSEPLQLQVTEQDNSTLPSGGSPGPAPCPSPVSVLGLPALLLTPSPGLPSLCTYGPRPSPLAQGPGMWSHLDTTVA